MNIQEAKEEIEKAVRAYTARTPDGAFRIPVRRQRPLLILGPPGIGKTAIMEQIARECGIGLVAYTMTHHTRQSAIGLPKLSERSFGGESYTVTTYTMSEIIASVYEEMEAGGGQEGILFLDEINCVSETLMPAMLQFLQYKTFGSHRLPEGWVIVAAGNPPAYNRSVREFDTVTLDRVRRIEVEPDLEIWKHYAIARGLHPAVLSFLTLRPERFYVMEPGHAGFVTGRAWEDLSEILETMEDLELSVGDGLFAQYLQDEDTAVEFCFYYRLYERWKDKLHPEDILKGQAGETLTGELPKLPFDERLCIVWLLLQTLQERGRQWDTQARFGDSLQYFLSGLRTEQPESLEAQVQEHLESRKRGFQIRKDNGLTEAGEEERELRLARTVRQCCDSCRLTGDMSVLSARTRQERDLAAEQKQQLIGAVRAVGQFVGTVFGEHSQEYVILLTGLMEHPALKHIIKEELPEVEAGAKACLDTKAREAALRGKL